MKTKRFAPKDAKLLRENPGKTPDELLALGLSRKAYERLGEEESFSPGKKIILPVKVEQAVPVSSKKTTVVRMANMRTGRIVLVGTKAANMLSTKYPKEFKILPS